MIWSWTRLKNSWVRSLERENIVWRERDSFSVERDMKKWKQISCWSYLKKSQLDGLRIFKICWDLIWWDLSCTKSRQIESVKVLLRICQRQKYLDGSNNYRAIIGQTKTFLMDQESVKKLLRQILDISMDRRCDKICREKKTKGLDR